MGGILLENKLLKIFKEILLINEDISIDISRDELQAWDSIAHIQLLSEIENKLNISVPIEDVDKIKKLSDFLKYAINS